MWYQNTFETAKKPSDGPGACNFLILHGSNNLLAIYAVNNTNKYEHYHQQHQHQTFCVIAETVMVIAVLISVINSLRGKSLLLLLYHVLFMVMALLHT